MLELNEKKLAHYTIQRRLAQGGMSQVFLAYDEHEKRNVAIKVVNRCEDDYVVRFRREVKTLSTLKHPHILPIYDYGEHGTWYYFVMPHIEQGTLRERLGEKAFTLEEAGAILEQLASALQFAHERGILHRDIKPSNILLKDEQYVYLADFGLAKDIEESSGLTQTGCLIGTPEYMAPELAEVPATTSCDIYALGILLYQLLTGYLPFKGSTSMATFMKHIKEQPKPPSQLNPAITYSIEQVILRAIEKDPERRYPTAQALAEAYAQALVATRQLQHEGAALVPQSLKLSSSQRIINLPSTQAARRLQPAYGIVVAAMLLLMLPLSLGFFTFNHDTPAAIGASIQLPSGVGTLHEKPPFARPTVQTAHPQNKANGTRQSNPGGGHGHRHRHDD